MDGGYLYYVHNDFQDTEIWKKNGFIWMSISQLKPKLEDTEQVKIYYLKGNYLASLYFKLK